MGTLEGPNISGPRQRWIECKENVISPPLFCSQATQFMIHKGGNAFLYTRDLLTPTIQKQRVRSGPLRFPNELPAWPYPGGP